MIKSSVYYSPQADQIVLMTPVYVEKTQAEQEVTFTEYDCVGYACDDDEVIIILHPAAIKHFEYIGEL